MVLFINSRGTGIDPLPVINNNRKNCIRVWLTWFPSGKDPVPEDEPAYRVYLPVPGFLRRTDLS